MPVPAAVQSWSDLDAEAKREHVLNAAAALLQRDGLEAPMPRVAAAAGVGVGTLYRLFSSREELIAALVIRRLEHFQADVATAQREADGGAALRAFVDIYVARTSSDEVLTEAMASWVDHEHVAPVKATATAMAEELLERARADGALRADVTMDDLHLLFTATRAGERALPGASARVAELMLRSLLR